MKSTLSYSVFYILIVCAFLSCNDGSETTSSTNSNDDSTTAGPVVQKDNKAENKSVTLDATYSNHDYAIALKIPQSWNVVEPNNVAGDNLAVNIFPRNRGIEQNLPKGIHADASKTFFSIYPKGLGTEHPPGETSAFAEAENLPQLSFAVDKQKSKVYYLKDGTPWGYFIVPQNAPSPWNEYGFILAQIGVDNYKASCFDKKTGKEKEIDKCDPLMGDKFVREGNLKTNDAEIVKAILESIQLSKEAIKEPVSNLIQLESPLPNKNVTFPLTVKVKARGYWFFEGSFPVKLYDANGKLLAQKNAKAIGSWMTEGFVPFSVQLSFTAPANERGSLVLEKSNPSGLPENDRNYTVQVIFSPR